MPTRVRLPDGSHVTVPTEDRQKAAEAARRYWQRQQQQSSKPRRAPPRKKKKEEGGFFDTASRFIDNVTDNALPNLGDEIAGFGGGIGSLITGNGWSEGYDNQRQRYLRRQREYKEDNPILSKVSAGTGMITSLGLPAGRVAEGANLAARSRQAAVVGAAYGAAAGAGNGEGLEDRLKQGAAGAGIGAAFGGATPTLVTGAQHGGRWARQHVPGVDAGMRAVSAVPQRVMQMLGREAGDPARSVAVEQADRMIGERMSRGNISDGLGNPGAAATPQRIAQEVQQRNARGVPAMVGDVTEEMRGLAEYAGRGIGPGQTLVRRALEGRKANEGQRIREHVQETFPTTDDPIRYLEEASQRMKEEAAPLYQEAYSQPVYRTAEIQGLEQTPAFRDALPQALRNIRNQIDPATGRPKDPREMGFREMVDVDPAGLPPNAPVFQAADGTWISYENGLTAEGYDQVIRAMRDSGRAAANVNPVTGAIENTTNSVHINGRASDLRGQLGAQNAPYREVSERYADEMGMQDAFRRGSDIGNMTGPEVAAVNRANPQANAQEAFTRGAGTAMAQEATQYAARYPNGNTANRIRQMLGDETKQRAVSEAQGNTGGTRELLERLEYENQGNQVYNRVNGGSPTAQRQQLDKDIDGNMGLPTSGRDLAMRVVSFFADRATPQFQHEVKERIAQVVTASDARSIQEIMEAIAAQAERDASFRQLLQRANVSLAGLYGMNIETE